MKPGLHELHSTCAVLTATKVDEQVRQPAGKAIDARNEWITYAQNRYEICVRRAADGVEMRGQCSGSNFMDKERYASIIGRFAHCSKIST